MNVLSNSDICVYGVYYIGIYVNVLSNSDIMCIWGILYRDICECIEQ